MTEVVLHRAITARSVGSRTTYEIPSRISSSRCVGAVRAAGRSGRRTSRIAPAEIAKVTASIAIVGPGPIVADRKPARAGPTIQPTVKKASKMAFARAISPRPTRPGTAAVNPASQRTRRAFMGNVTRRMRARVGPPSQTEIGMTAVSTARPRSAENIILRRSQRSA